MFIFLFDNLVIRFTQTLKTLNLSFNEIGPRGAEHLANALQQNKVTYNPYLIIHSLFYIDTHYTGPAVQ